MMGLFLTSAAITVFIVTATLILMLSGNEAGDSRLMEIAARRQPVNARAMTDVEKNGLARMAAVLTRALQPIRHLLARSDEDLAYRLTLAGFPKADHDEVHSE